MEGMSPWMTTAIDSREEPDSKTMVCKPYVVTLLNRTCMYVCIHACMWAWDSRCV